MRLSSLLEFRCIVLNPSPDRRVVDLQAAFDQQLLDITIRKGVAKVPANGAKNDLGGEVSPLEDRRPVALSHDLSSIAVLILAVLLPRIQHNRDAAPTFYELGKTDIGSRSPELPFPVRWLAGA